MLAAEDPRGSGRKCVIAGWSAGQTSAVGAFGDFNTLPRWQGTAFLTYDIGPLAVVLQARVIGSGTYAAVNPNTNLKLLVPTEARYDSAKPNDTRANRCPPVPSRWYSRFAVLDSRGFEALSQASTDRPQCGHRVSNE